MRIGALAFLLPGAVLLPGAALAAAAVHSAAVRSTKKPVELTPWQIAEQARGQLMSIPPEQRTRDDYNTVMDAYRLIYHANPGDVHAPESIYNVAGLLVDEGVTLHQPKMLDAAMGQYEFLRKQYPGSSLRGPALLAEAHLASDNMRDVKQARARYAEYVQLYPHSSHAEEAQTALRNLKAGLLPPSPQEAAVPAAASPTRASVIVPAASPSSSASRTRASAAAASNGVPGSSVLPAVHAEASLAASRSAALPSTAVPAPDGTTTSNNTGNGTITNTSNGTLVAAANVPAHTRSGLATVSAIRHWSTPTYTRVAIDLGDEVQYEAARVPGPDRIYFDLHGTRLAQELAGKSFTVTDDGFLKRIRAAQYSNDMTRVVLDVSDVTEYSAFLLPNPYRLIIDIHGAQKPVDTGSNLAAAAQTRPGDDLLKPPAPTAAAPVQRTPPVTAGAFATGVSSPPLDVPEVPSTVATRSTSGREVAGLSTQPDNQRATNQPTSQPIAVVADPHASQLQQPTQPTGKKSKKNDKSIVADNAAPGHAAAPTSDGERTMQRALGLKIGRIVIDPGHGGHDSGTLGAGGIMEKDVVLDVALRLGKMLHDKLGAEIIYTRSDDTFIPLETRTAIANKAEADLFISVHANSSQDETARGVETYYLNFTSQPDALDVAARENAVSDAGVHQLADLVKKITLKDKIDESREFAADVEKGLYDGLRKGNDGLKDRGVKKAPFVVLIGANMPSILTEISFVTNGKDAAQLRTPEYRERVAASIFKGVASYTSGLSGSGTHATTAAASTAKADPRGE